MATGLREHRPSLVPPLGHVKSVRVENGRVVVELSQADPQFANPTGDFV